MVVRVVVLGAGFGGLEVAAALSERMGDGVEVTLIDRGDAFVFGFAKLDVMFGRRTVADVSHRYARIDRPGVRFVRARIARIDPEARRVATDAGTFQGDHLVVALGADLDPAATPGMVEDGHEFYTTAGAFGLREVLESFDGGRVVVGVAAPVFKCPPAPGEVALLVDDLLRRRGLRERSEIALTAPLPSPLPPVPEASAGLAAAFAEHGVRWHPDHAIDRVDAASHEVVFTDGHRLGYELFLGVPRHVVPAVVVASGLSDGEWVQVDRTTFRTRFPGVWAIGDIADTGTPKAGMFAAGQGDIVAAGIAAESGLPGDVPPYDGAGICYVGFGGTTAAKVDVAFAPGAAPRGSFGPASADHAAEKERYRAETVRRWFGGE